MLGDAGGASVVQDKLARLYYSMQKLDTGSPEEIIRKRNHLLRSIQLADFKGYPRSCYNANLTVKYFVAASDGQPKEWGLITIVRNAHHKVRLGWEAT